MLEERAAALAHELEASEAKALRLERVNADLRSASQQLSRSLMEREAELQRVTRIASTSSYALGRVQSSVSMVSATCRTPRTPRPARPRLAC